LYLNNPAINSAAHNKPLQFGLLNAICSRIFAAANNNYFAIRNQVSHMAIRHAENFGRF
jgi:hypothetical protein